MNRPKNQDRAQKMVDGWPSWKKEVSLTKYSASSECRSPKEGSATSVLSTERKNKST